MKCLRRESWGKNSVFVSDFGVLLKIGDGREGSAGKGGIADELLPLLSLKRAGCDVRTSFTRAQNLGQPCMAGTFKQCDAIKYLIIIIDSCYLQRSRPGLHIVLTLSKMSTGHGASLGVIRDIGIS